MALYHTLLLGLLLVAGGFAVGVMWFALASINQLENDE